MKIGDDYVMGLDVQVVHRTYLVTDRDFSIALLKIRYDAMDDASQRRAEKTLLSLKDGRFWR